MENRGALRVYNPGEAIIRDDSQFRERAGARVEKGERIQLPQQPSSEDSWPPQPQLSPQPSCSREGTMGRLSRVSPGGDAFFFVASICMRLMFAPFHETRFRYI
ncbi:MAG: hypothetical protein A3K68_05625 [Euryarchaeota archaeon RBG_16_68_13]|nr:MAG: hypothetical protein A3K68_05625 [Euryarchaeota archaeon RBG_16_68_13]